MEVEAQTWAEEAPATSAITRGSKNPLDIVIDNVALSGRRGALISNAQHLLWDPRKEDSKGIFAFGPELGQYGALPLKEALLFAKKIGSRVVQPSGNHINLVRAATDQDYRLEVRQAFFDAGLPLLSVSIHCDAYAALAVRDNKRARMFTPPSLGDSDQMSQLDQKTTSNLHLDLLALMIQGAAELGIPALHLFWGTPQNLPAYKWAPVSADEIRAMREEFVRLVTPLVLLAGKLDIKLCHEIHFGTIAANAQDLIQVWKMLGEPENFCVGFDPSHFWHGETWWQALDKLGEAGMEVILAHAKNTVLFPGRPILGYEADDRRCGMSFTSLDSPHGIVDFVQYGGLLTLSGIVEFWHDMGLPVPLYAEAENPFFRIEDVSRKAIEFLDRTLGGYHMPQGHFTDQMVKK